MQAKSTTNVAIAILITSVFIFSQCESRNATRQNNEALMKDWRQVNAVWCRKSDLPEAVIDTVYECFENSTSEEEYEVQIACEHELFASSMSSNEVRRKMCTNDPKMVQKFDECYTRHRKSKGLEKGGTQEKPTDDQKAAEEAQLRRLIECMKGALGLRRGLKRV